ncbi:MAG: flavodoxin family protein [Clostridiales bacterium]|nr:flavodoxin family protein [Clostridiales bacterium]
MKKVAVIWSSPNVDGLTASAKNQFLSGLEEAGAQVEEIHLNKKKIEHCRACGNGWGTCNKTGSCVIADDFSEIYKTLAEVDGIVWISAVYWSDMTECFKAFFDRLRRCDATMNHALAEKRCVIMGCAGGTGRGSLECMTQFERGLTHMGMRVYDRISVVRYNKDYILPMLKEAGKTYAETLETGFNMYY